jgi:hypothetical protein
MQVPFMTLLDAYFQIFIVITLAVVTDCGHSIINIAGMQTFSL